MPVPSVAACDRGAGLRPAGTVTSADEDAGAAGCSAAGRGVEQGGGGRAQGVSGRPSATRAQITSGRESVRSRAWDGDVRLTLQVISLLLS